MNFHLTTFTLFLFKFYSFLFEFNQFSDQGQRIATISTCSLFAVINLLHDSLLAHKLRKVQCVYLHKYWKVLMQIRHCRRIKLCMDLP